MPRYVLTGTPGAGKTAILRQLELDGFSVVEESATDVIALEQALGCAEPWERAGFTDAIATLQRQRERAAPLDRIAFFDRSPVCTLALSRYLGRPPSALLAAELKRVVTGRVFERAVFFVRCPGFVTPTAARRISLADALAFEKIHADTYIELGFRLIDVPAGLLRGRAALVRRTATRLAAGEAPPV